MNEGYFQHSGKSSPKPENQPASIWILDLQLFTPPAHHSGIGQAFPPRSITKQNNNVNPKTIEETTPLTCSSMNGKPVLNREARTILNLKNHAFQEKLLCDGPTFSSGDSCAYSCHYCYVPAIMHKLNHARLRDASLTAGHRITHADVVIRRENSRQVLASQLLSRKGHPKFSNPRDRRIIYSSPLVDVAGNMELLRETADLCNLILKHTNWNIRLLSKSNLLLKLVESKLIPEQHHHRLILGFSTGTLNDRLASVIERGTAHVSKRIEALHWLQDRGIRTFGMICPSPAAGRLHAVLTGNLQRHPRRPLRACVGGGHQSSRRVIRENSDRSLRSRLPR